VMYFESTNNGDDWLDGSQWPPTIHNVTNYPTGAKERAYTDVAACYDYNDSLHIVWNGCFFDSVAGTINTVKSNLYHWSKVTGKVLVAPGQWENTNPGAWNRSLSKMSISTQDPIYHPGGTPDSVFLFCTWTQFNPGDTSLSGMGNGDIYGAVSNNGGLSWGFGGFNLTNTKTPNCAPGACLSEHWSSMAENMYNGDLHIEYVCDRDAGGIVQPSEGTWTDNPMMYIHVPFPYEHCGWAYPTIVDPPSWTTPPIKVPPSGSRAILLKVRTQTGHLMNYEVTTDHPKVICVNNCSGYLNPGDSAIVEARINCSGEEFINATLNIRFCMGWSWEDSVQIPLYAVCDSNDYYECKCARETQFSQDNDICSLWVCVNTSQEVYDLRVRDEDGDPNRSIFSSGVIVATSAGSDKIVGRQEDNYTYTGARDTIRVVRGYDYVETTCDIQKTYVEKTYIWYPRVLNPLTSDIRWWWININKQIITFHDKPGYTCPEWKKEQVIKHVWITWGRPPVWWPNPGTYQGHEDIYLGTFADPDAPSDTGCGSCNTAGWDDTRKLMWLHGRYAGQHPEYDDYYVGLTFTDTLGGVVDPYAKKNVRNDIYIYPQEGWRTDSLYQLATIAGLWIQDPDSVKDRSVVMTAYKIPASSNPNDTTFQKEFILIEALIEGSTEQGLTQLQTHIDDTRNTLIPELQNLGLFSKNFPICGDLTDDGMVDASDIVYLLNYLFVHGPQPPWPMSRADVTNEGEVDAGDLVYLLNYLFVNGPEPHCSGFGR
jgi:hypothetical protein